MMMPMGIPVTVVRFPAALQGPLPTVPLGQSGSSSPGEAQGYTKPLCLCKKLREQDAERAARKKHR